MLQDPHISLSGAWVQTLLFMNILNLLQVFPAHFQMCCFPVWLAHARPWHAAVSAELISLGDLNRKMAIQSGVGNDIYVSPACFR